MSDEHEQDQQHEHGRDGHGHHHPHPKQPDLEDAPLTYYQCMTEAVRELLLEKAVITPDQLRMTLEAIDASTPAVGAALVAKAWVDPDFKARLLASVNEAAAGLGIDAGFVPIKAVENTPERHNVIVCTLCSCYPKYLIGAPPGWYKARAYRSRVVREPRAVLAEFGTHIPDDVSITVHDSTADFRYMVLPRRPRGTEGLSESELADLVTRDCLIGVAVPQGPGATSGSRATPA